MVIVAVSWAPGRLVGVEVVFPHVMERGSTLDGGSIYLMSFFSEVKLSY